MNFAQFSEHAERVELCLLTPKAAVRPNGFDALADRSGMALLPSGGAARPPLRLSGARAPRSEKGLRFNPNKVLLDPYAKQIVGSIKWSDAFFGYRVGAPREDLTAARRDCAAGMPRCRIVDTAFL